MTSPQDLRKLEAANKQNVHAFNHVLDVAYGRKGKLKRELMEVEYFFPDPMLHFSDMCVV